MKEKLLDYFKKNDMHFQTCVFTAEKSYILRDIKITHNEETNEIKVISTSSERYKEIESLHLLKIIYAFIGDKSFSFRDTIRLMIDAKDIEKENIRLYKKVLDYEGKNKHNHNNI